MQLQKIEVIYLFGRNCLSIAGHGEHVEPQKSEIVNQINVSSLSQGLYLLKCTDEKGLVHQTKFVKQ